MGNQSEIVGGALFTPLAPELSDISKLGSGASYSSNAFAAKTAVPGNAATQPKQQLAPPQTAQVQPPVTQAPQPVAAPVQPQAAPANFCVACGAKVTPGSRFCEECGYAL